MRQSYTNRSSVFKHVAILLCMIFALAGNICRAAVEHSSGYIQADKAKLYYQRFGTGTPILVLHGGPGLDQSYLQPQMLELAKQHEVIFYDQRGSGKSLDTTMEPAYYNLTQFTKDVEVVRQQLGIDKFVLMGHSFGGLLAMSYAIKYPEHVSKLVLVDTTPADVTGIMAAVQEITKRTEPFKEEIYPLSNYHELEKLDAAQIAALHRKLFSVYMHDPKDADKLSLVMSVESARSGFKVNELFYRSLFINLFPQLKKLQVPTLIIHGTHDIVPMWTVEQIHKAISNSQLKVIENSGHFPYIEKPDEFFKLIA